MHRGADDSHHEEDSMLNGGRRSTLACILLAVLATVDGEASGRFDRGTVPKKQSD
ncbi:MAG: hypothetical protein ACREMU_03520 [Gemmatimonadaceae bacterium]